MKTEILSINGERIKEIELPSLFSEKIREDIVKKAFEAEKEIQPYGPDPRAGRQHSASGRIKHARHKWGSAYGRGISRVPRKTMWRRGTQFYWVGAEASAMRGGRRAHPPKPYSMINNKKINKKEMDLAIKSALAGTADLNKIISRYSTLSEKNSNLKIKNLPIVVESKFAGLKTKELVSSMKKILGEMFGVAERKKSQRAGKGKMRNRRIKKSAGILIITGSKEKIKAGLFENKSIKELEIKDLYPLGRLTIYTENAIEELKKFNVEKVKTKKTEKAEIKK